MNEQENVKNTAITDQITNLVNTHWKKFHSALMLSTLGVALREGGFNISSDLGGRRLADFVTEEMPAIQIVKFSTNAQKIGVVPKHVVIDNNHDKLFIKIEKSVSSNPKPPDIPNVLWYAFTRPLATEYSRYVFAKPKLSYRDIRDDISSTATTDSKKIDKHLIISDFNSHARIKNELIKNIRDWMELHRSYLNISPSNVEHVEINASRTRAEASLLHKIIASLSTNELSRTTLPLDVVSRLLNTI